MDILLFNTDLMPAVLDELNAARQFIRIASPRLNSPPLFDLLEEKLASGVTVEILTLPYDSIAEGERRLVEDRCERLSGMGAKIHLCRWNVGDLDQAETTADRRYSYHGNFLVTDASAVVSSGDWVATSVEPELDALLIHLGDDDKIEDYSATFDWLVWFFVTECEGHEGSVRQLVERALTGEHRHVVGKVFALPARANRNHEGHWINDYPGAMCLPGVEIRDAMFVTPIDARALNLLVAALDHAETFAYVATDTFTDPRFASVLQRTRERGVDVRVLCGGPHRSDPNHTPEIADDLLHSGIAMRTPKGAMRGTLVITDHHMVLGSVNLTRMSLGWEREKGYWTASTETLEVCSDPGVIDRAKEPFEQAFNEPLGGSP